MTAKHHAPHPKRRQKPDDLEKRVRRIERNYMREIVKTATHIARHEANRAIREHEDAYAHREPQRPHADYKAGDTVSWLGVPGATSYNIYGKTPTEVLEDVASKAPPVTKLDGAVAQVVSGRTIHPGKSSKPEGPRAQKET